jgi:hypothetical protein
MYIQGHRHAHQATETSGNGTTLADINAQHLYFEGRPRDTPKALTPGMDYLWIVLNSSNAY